MMERSRDERLEMGRRGRALVEKNYAWNRLAENMADLYAWLAGGGVEPATVVKE
jgi:poly(glycerol-phosphate) alpha-glucosyltransferase